MKMKIFMALAAGLMVFLTACGNNANQQPVKNEYKLESVHRVNGRQGIAQEGDYYWVRSFIIIAPSSMAVG